MPTPAHSWGMSRIRLDSHNLVTTKQRIQRQLAAVIQLSEHNSEYLESFERSWIEYLITEATLLTGDAQVPGWSNSQQGGRTSPFGMRPESRVSSDAATEVDMNTLLATSRSLNSANSLLSCCYDRWLWLQSAQSQQIASSPETEDLQELLGRRRHQRRQSNNVSSPPSEPMESPPRNETTSSTSSRVGTTGEDGSEHSLSLAMDFTIERWRQNAEDALNEATTRLATGVTNNPQSPTQQNLQEAWTNPPYIAKRTHPSVKVSGGLVASRLCTSPTTSFTQGPAMPPARHSIRGGSASYPGVSGTICEHCSHGPNPEPHHVERSNTTRSSFRSTLHNSFEKEAVSYRALPAANSPPHSPPPPQSSHRLSDPHSAGLSETNLWLPHSNHRTSDLGLGFAPIDTNNNTTTTSGRARDTLHTSMSMTSVLSSTSSETHVPRSRGRRWLEQQAGRTVTDY